VSRRAASAGRSRAGQSLTAVATAVKLWPALLLPALAARRDTRSRVVATVAAIGVALGGASLVLAGWGRLFSPLTWQHDRGLHVESVLATPAALAWALHPDEHEVYFSAFNAFEIRGPGVAGLLLASTVLTVLAVLVLVTFWVLAWRRGDDLSGDTVGWLALAALTAYLVTGKVLSPQYLLWLLPVVAAALAVARTERARRRLARWAVLLLVATAATQVVFPVGYGGIVEHQPWSIWVVLVLAVRNALLVWLMFHALAEARWHLQARTEYDDHPGSRVRT